MNYLTRIAADEERLLLQADWHLDGWRYAWLRSVEKSRRRLLHAGRAFDLTLFVAEAETGRRYAARIDGVECLDAAHAEAIRSIAAEHGWLPRPGSDEASPGATFNVRFRPDRIHRYPADMFASPDDPIMQLHRFQLHGTDDTPSRLPALPFEPERAAMRACLMADLRRRHPGAVIESNADDVVMHCDGRVHVFRVRTELEPRAAIRSALGDVVARCLDGIEQASAMSVIIAGKRPAEAADLRYLSMMRTMFGLPVEYREVSYESG